MQHGIESRAKSQVVEDDGRLAALDRYDLLDTPQEDSFDRVTRLARKIFDVPIAAINLVDAHRQWCKSCLGLGVSETPLELSFCRFTVEADAPFVVPDAHADARFANNPVVVGEPHLRFYAGVPLPSPDGYNIGALCIADRRPRLFTRHDVDLLKDLADLVVDQLELRRLAARDGLTGALTRRAFKDEATRLVALARRHGHDLSCIAIDLDHFKRINDAYGHAAGDKVLQQAVATSMLQLRQSDMLGRFGGEEFVVFLPNTGAAGAMVAAEKLREGLAEAEVTLDTEVIRFTASFGVASLDAATTSLDSLLIHADKALYEAKRSGRNRCVAWASPGADPMLERRRVLRAAKILVDGGRSSIDCTIRGLAAEGADLQVSSLMGIPPRFDLHLVADDTIRQCKVVTHSERRLDVEFC